MYHIFEHPYPSVLVTTHRSIDADAFGSTFAAAIAMHRRGVDVKVAFFGAKPPWFDSVYEKTIPLPFRSIPVVWDEFDEQRQIVLVDASNIRRCCDDAPNIPIWFIVDHHNVHVDDVVAAWSVLDKEAPSCTVAIYKMMKEYNVDVDEVIARLLYIGLAGDTVLFSTPSTTASAHTYAAEFLRLAPDAHVVFLETMKLPMAISDFILLAESMAHCEFLVDPYRTDSAINVIVFYCENTLLARMLMRMINALNPPETIDVFAYVSPIADETYRVSFRSSNGKALPLARRVAAALDVEFGGHDNAAGIQSISGVHKNDVIDAIIEAAEGE